MSEDPHRRAFRLPFSVFTFAMLSRRGDNFIQLFFG